MPTPGIRLGVDFGTSNTVAVVRWPDGRSRPLLFDGSPLLPSAVYVEPNGAIIVGRDAVHSARLEPARFEPNPKRRIDDGTVLLGDRGLPVNELIAAVLRRVRDEWARTVGGNVAPEVSLTFPASWGATRRLAVADAAAAAGLGRVRLVPEPVAAAAYFTQVLGRDVPVGSVVVVHDFGAGTFDASVVARTAGGFEVLAVDGRDDIGGVDVDAAIVAHIGTICQPQAPEAWQRLMSPTTVEDRRHRRMLWDDARVAKERLSRQPASDLTIPLLNIDVHLTREELERLSQPLLDQTVRVTQGVMRWAQLSEGTIAGVFLVGGSSRMPLVATLLHRALGAAPVAIEQPELVVAEGSMLTGSTAIPAGAAPAPGPTTGGLPPVPGFNVQNPGGTPVSAPPGVPASAPPSGGAPVPVSPGASGGGGGVDGLLWPDAGTFNAEAAPVSGTPGSAPPAGYPAGGQAPGGYPGGGQAPGVASNFPASAPPSNHPASAPPSGYSSGPGVASNFPASAPPSNFPASAPPSNFPASAPPSNHPASAPPSGYSSGPGVASNFPASAPPSNFPASAPPSNYPGAPSPSDYPASAPPSGYQGAPVSAPPSGYQGAPGGGYQAGPVSAPPGNYHPGQVSGPPGTYGAGQVSAPPGNYAAGQPVSAPPNRPVSAGRVFVSGGTPPTEQATRYDEFGSPVRPGTVPPPAPPRARPQPPVSNPAARPQSTYSSGKPRRGPFARAVLTLFVLVLLVAMPVVAGYVSYYLTTDHWPPPADAWFDPTSR
jgi:hypothetical protein